MKVFKGIAWTVVAAVSVLIITLSAVFTVRDKKNTSLGGVYPTFSDAATNDIISSISNAAKDAKSEKISEDVFNHLGVSMDLEMGVRTDCVSYSTVKTENSSTTSYSIGTHVTDSQAPRVYQKYSFYRYEQDKESSLTGIESYSIVTFNDDKTIKNTRSCAKSGDEWLWSPLVSAEEIEAELNSIKHEMLTISTLMLIPPEYINYSFEDYSYENGVYVLSTSGVIEDDGRSYKHIVKFKVKNDKLTWIFLEDTILMTNGMSLSIGFEGAISRGNHTVTFPADLPPVPEE